MYKISSLVICIFSFTGLANCCSLDLVYLIDSSESVGEQNFASLQNFLTKVTPSLDIEPTKTHLSLVQYSRTVNILQNFKSLQTSDSSVQVISKMIYYHPSATATGDALRALQSSILKSDNGDRTSVPDVIVLFTDGLTDVGETPSIPAKELRDAGVKIIAVGLGSEPNEELKQIAGENILMYTNYANLDAKVTELINKIGCN